MRQRYDLMRVKLASFGLRNLMGRLVEGSESTASFSFR